MRGVDVRAVDTTSAQERIGLAKVFVSLDTTTQVKSKETRGSRGLETMLERDTRPLGALEATIANRHLVVVGAPLAA